MFIKVVTVGFHMLPASINPQQGVAAQTASQELQISRDDCEVQETRLLGVPGAPPSATFLLANTVLSSLYFLANRS